MISPVSISLPAHAATASSDPLQARALSQLHAFTNWLEANNVKGYIGEVGWPSSPQWNSLADAWYQSADENDLWVTGWATGEWWGTSYPLSSYVASSGRSVDTARPQASVIEQHATDASYLRGVNVAGGEFAAPSAAATSSFSNSNPGTYGVDYHYDSQATFDYLASRGIKLVRIPFRWERLQPRLGRPLDSDELARLKAVVKRAGDAGLKVVLDLHNYGAYYLSNGTEGVRRAIGTPQVPIWRFAEIWGRISNNFKKNPAVAGYGLMNEPWGLPSVKGRTPVEEWQAASQAAVDRIRRNGDHTLITVAGYNWSGVQRWPQIQPAAWIHDPTGNFRYEAHAYWDADNSGTYGLSYEQEVAVAEASGY